MRHSTESAVEHFLRQEILAHPRGRTQSIVHWFQQVSPIPHSIYVWEHGEEQASVVATISNANRLMHAVEFMALINGCPEKWDKRRRAATCTRLTDHNSKEIPWSSKKKVGKTEKTLRELRKCLV